MDCLVTIQVVTGAAVRDGIQVSRGTPGGIRSTSTNVRRDLRVALGEAVNTKRLNCIMCSSPREKVAEIGLEDALILGQILAFQNGAAELDHIAALGEL